MYIIFEKYYYVKVYIQNFLKKPKYAHLYITKALVTTI
jgi:hypothetical protein